MHSQFFHHNKVKKGRKNEMSFLTSHVIFDIACHF